MRALVRTRRRSALLLLASVAGGDVESLRAPRPDLARCRSSAVSLCSLDEGGGTDARDRSDRSARFLVFMQVGLVRGGEAHRRPGVSLVRQRLTSWSQPTSAVPTRGRPEISAPARPSCPSPRPRVGRSAEARGSRPPRPPHGLRVAVAGQARPPVLVALAMKRPEAGAHQRVLAPSLQISSKIDRQSAPAVLLFTTLSAGVACSPARQRRPLVFDIGEEGTPRLRGESAIHKFRPYLRRRWYVR